MAHRPPGSLTTDVTLRREPANDLTSERRQQAYGVSVHSDPTRGNEHDNPNRVVPK